MTTSNHKGERGKIAPLEKFLSGFGGENGKNFEIFSSAALFLPPPYP